MIRSFSTLAAILSLLLGVPAAAGPDPLRAGFAAPPQEARPWLWWHWMDGNISREGIDLDLAWMHRIGIGGFQIFDIKFATPQIVGKRLIYMSPEWRDAFRYAIGRADALGMEAGIASSAGWSETGGAWITPEQAMKKLVWSETPAKGGRRFTGRLALPPSAAGPFQDLGRADAPKAEGAPFYRDVAVLAYRVPADAVPPPPVRVTSSGGQLDPLLLEDSRLDRPAAVTLPMPSRTEPSWIRFDYARPRTVRALALALASVSRYAVPPPTRLEASDDGVTFRPVAEMPAGAFRQNTVSFAPVTARSFRLVFTLGDDGPFWARVNNVMAPGVIEPAFAAVRRAPDIGIVRLALLGDARVSRFEEKAGFATAPDYYALATPAAGAGSTVAAESVIDLTSKLRPDGSLDWVPPPGRWTVLRLGTSLTGQTNGPAPAEATGYEVDKLNAGHVGAYMERYLGIYRDLLGPDLFGRRGVGGVMTDSFEAGVQNWTETMVADFRRLRGYDPTPWLPALTGRIIGSAEASDRFLWDYRRTIADLLATNHYGEAARRAHAAGIVLRSEALEDRRPILGDDMAMRAPADEPMGAIWSPGANGQIERTQIADLKGAASVGHLYGRASVGAEAFTSALQPWRGSPRNLKHTADAALALGVTRFMIHSAVHQPVTDKVPGMSISFFGQFFSRNETWADQARPWIDYLARGSFLLRQGHYAADIAYFYGEEAPLTGLYSEAEVADVPEGHGYDFVNADALLNLLEARGGRLVTPSGMHYRVLQLGGTSQRMTLAVLRRIAALAEAGVPVIGARPKESPSLADDPAEFARLADRLWGSGRILDLPPAQAMARLGIAPDWQAGAGAPPLMVLHRTLGEGEIYFVSSRARGPAKAEISFRVAGRAPELWDADTGEITPLGYRVEDGRTIVPLAFDPDGSAFVVFREPSTAASRAVAPASETPLLDLDAGWTLAFQNGRGGPAGVLPAAAGSWSESADPRIRYFSGTGTYTREITLPPGAPARGRVILDLGDVAELVEVVVNGRVLRTLWKPPYRIDVTDSLKPGSNRIELRVTNLWVNRLIGDAQPGAAPITFTTATTYRPDAPLLSSGLIGPMRLIRRD